MLADAASPAALFTIGAVRGARCSALVARRQPKLVLARVGDVLPVVVIKLHRPRNARPEQRGQQRHAHEQA